MKELFKKFKDRYKDQYQKYITENSNENLLLVAICIEKFIKDLFKIDINNESHKKDLEILEFKRDFVRKEAIYKYKDINEKIEFDYKDDISFVEHIKSIDINSNDYDKALKFAAFASQNNFSSILFSHPKPTSNQEFEQNGDIFFSSKQKNRDGFKLSEIPSRLEALDQSFYCIKCHKRDKDSCSKGLNENLKGCPLNQKISQMHTLFEDGYIIAALAVITLDNPMVAATGHRICNDCISACIFQKQTAVNTPLVETAILRLVLDLPFGFEIYSLLTMWNPLNIETPFPKDKTGKKILVVGAGPAGFTLAHYLLNEGHDVTCIDGLKIEPLPNISGYIKNWKDFTSDLDQRVVDGFGGVLEYGITIRYDKNFLLLIRMILERRERFSLFGGILFEDTITKEQAFEMGFNHIGICTGAGGPKLLNIENGLSKGIMYASDFLMTLQLGGAFKKDSLTNLQIELPLVVIGGGLTAIDCATEALAYYEVQVKKISELYKNQKIHENDEKRLMIFLKHSELLKNAKNYKEKLEFLNSFGGVTILYRNSLYESPSYRLNKQELLFAFEEGVRFKQNTTPMRFLVDNENHVSGIETKDGVIKAKTVIIAIGTMPSRFSNYFNDNRISIYGDIDPKFKGSVVKAMQSAKEGYKLIRFEQ